jgi:hypothetical protein
MEPTIIVAVTAATRSFFMLIPPARIRQRKVRKYTMYGR